jgi:hypothetical protein
MQTIKLRSHVGEDGILHLDIPLNMKGTDLEITMTVEAVKTNNNSGDSAQDLSQLSWHEFIEKTAGSCADDPIILDQGGIDESLDDDLEGAFD